MKVIYETFDSLAQFLDVIEKRPPNKVFSSRGLASKSGDDDFTMTKSYEESIKIAQNGYHKGLESMKISEFRSQQMGKVAKNTPFLDVVGYAPHIPNAITGIPQSMISTSPTEQRAKVISILYYMGGNAGIDTDSFVEAGKNVLDVIHTLEMQGYRVGLNVMQSFCQDDERTICSIQIKNWRQPSNPLKMAYPLIHPSFFRRNGFRWLETQPELTNHGFTFGYGRPLDRSEGRDSDTERRRRWLAEQGILKSGWFYTEREEAEDKTAEELIKCMGIM